MICKHCELEIFYQDSPQGGWWIHIGKWEVCYEKWAPGDYCPRHSIHDYRVIPGGNFSILHGTNIDHDAEPNVTCHCGREIKVHEDQFTRELCEECDTVRCDAFPQECPFGV